MCVYAGPALGGAGPNWVQFQSAQVPSQLAPRSVELGAISLIGLRLALCVCTHTHTHIVVDPQNPFGGGGGGNNV